MEIRAQAVPESPEQGVAAGAIKFYDKLVLVEEERNKYSTNLKCWVSPSYGASYGAILCDGNDKPIPHVHSCNWCFDYHNGIVVFDHTDGLATPFKITGYRYVGEYIGTQ